MTYRETIACVEKITPLTDSILLLVLRPEQYIDYQAGQYLQLLVGDAVSYYSIANAPLGSRKYELHIRHSRENALDESLLKALKEEGAVTVRAPFGTCDLLHLDPVKPIIFIAAGTGFSPVHAMIEQLLALGDKRKFELIWGARSQSDLYLDEKVNKWQNHVQHFHYESLLAQPNKQTLASVVFSRHEFDLKDWQIVISGPFDMVYSTRDQLIELGAEIKNIYSDAFQFEDKV